MNVKHTMGYVLVLQLSLGLSACAPAATFVRAPDPVPALPPIPRVDGPIQIRVAYPNPLLTKPNVDSTFIFGTVSTGSADLTINGFNIPVAPNGAFLAYLPVPEDGQYELVATRWGYRYGYSFGYYEPLPSPSSPGSAATELTEYEQPRVARVIGGRDTLATGSDTKHAAPTPEGDRKWFFPQGARIMITGERGNNARVRLTDDTIAWTELESLEWADDSLSGPTATVGRVEVTSSGRNNDIAIAAGYAPFLVTPDGRDVYITVYNRLVQQPIQDEAVAIRNIEWVETAPDSSILRVQLERDLWGYKAFYTDGGYLVIRLREAPAIDAGNPFRDLRIVVDPGHPPGGAIGPTGLTEPEANLAISLRLADMLEARGARVIMTRTTPEVLESETSTAEELWARVDFAVENNADLLVSVHNNAFPDGVNPFEYHGTETYYFHPFSQSLAVRLFQEIAETTGIRPLGAKQRSLALVRPTWMPSTLTESLFMMFPQQEAALRNEEFLSRLAAAHVQGIELFLRSLIDTTSSR